MRRGMRPQTAFTGRPEGNSHCGSTAEPALRAARNSDLGLIFRSERTIARAKEQLYPSETTEREVIDVLAAADGNAP